MCLGEGQLNCAPKECPPCSGSQHPEVNLNCQCICKDCNQGEKLCATSNVCLAEEKWCDGVEHCLDDEVGCDVEERSTTPAYLPGKFTISILTWPLIFFNQNQPIKDFHLMVNCVLPQDVTQVHLQSKPRLRHWMVVPITSV